MCGVGGWRGIGQDEMYTSQWWRDVRGCGGVGEDKMPTLQWGFAWMRQWEGKGRDEQSSHQFVKVKGTNTCMFSRAHMFVCVDIHVYLSESLYTLHAQL